MALGLNSCEKKVFIFIQGKSRKGRREMVESLDSYLYLCYYHYYIPYAIYIVLWRNSFSWQIIQGTIYTKISLNIWALGQSDWNPFFEKGSRLKWYTFSFEGGYIFKRDFGNAIGMSENKFLLSVIGRSKRYHFGLGLIHILFFACRNKKECICWLYCHSISQTTAWNPENLWNKTISWWSRLILLSLTSTDNTNYYTIQTITF